MSLIFCKEIEKEKQSRVLIRANVAIRSDKQSEPQREGDSAKNIGLPNDLSRVQATASVADFKNRSGISITSENYFHDLELFLVTSAEANLNIKPIKETNLIFKAAIENRENKEKEKIFIGVLRSSIMHLLYAANLQKTNQGKLVRDKKGSECFIKQGLQFGISTEKKFDLNFSVGSEKNNTNYYSACLSFPKNFSIFVINRNIEDRRRTFFHLVFFDEEIISSEVSFCKKDSAFIERNFSVFFIFDAMKIFSMIYEEERKRSLSFRVWHDELIEKLELKVVLQYSAGRIELSFVISFAGITITIRLPLYGVSSTCSIADVKNIPNSFLLSESGIDFAASAKYNFEPEEGVTKLRLEEYSKEEIVRLNEKIFDNIEEEQDEDSDKNIFEDNQANEEDEQSYEYIKI